MERSGKTQAELREAQLTKTLRANLRRRKVKAQAPMPAEGGGEDSKT